MDKLGFFLYRVMGDALLALGYGLVAVGLAIAAVGRTRRYGIVPSSPTRVVTKIICHPHYKDQND